MPPKKKEGKSKPKKKIKSKPNPDEQESLDLLQIAAVYTSDINNERALEEKFLHQSEILKHYWEVEKNLRDVSSKY